MMKLISFIPQTDAYLIFYPETFLLDEAEDGIVSITSNVTSSNLTLSDYQVNQIVTEKILVDMLIDITRDYEPRSEYRIIETNHDCFVERACFKDEVNWIWWGISKDNQIIIVSINSKSELSMEDYKLFRFMMDKMEIYPAESEEE